MNPWANPPAKMVISRRPPTSLAFTFGDISASRPIVAVVFMLFASCCDSQHCVSRKTEQHFVVRSPTTSSW
jgi:hypothetical protein